MLEQTFARVALSISNALGGPFHDATLRRPGLPVFDAGGSIEYPGMSVETPCSAQVDTLTEAMRGQGYVDGEVRLIVIAETPVTQDHTVKIEAGPHSGTTWRILTVTRDPLGLTWDCRASRAD